MGGYLIIFTHSAPFRYRTLYPIFCSANSKAQYFIVCHSLNSKVYNMRRFAIFKERNITPNS